MIVTGLNIKYKLIYGILVYVNGDVFRIVNFYFLLFPFYPLSLIKNNKYRARIYFHKYPTLTDKLYLYVFLLCVFKNDLIKSKQSRNVGEPMSYCLNFKHCS